MVIEENRDAIMAMLAADPSKVGWLVSLSRF